MTATNHAVTGALIGLAISNPMLAVPLAVLSHFALDAVPHFDPPAQRSFKTKYFIRQLLLDASLCGLLVIGLAIAKPHHWLVAAICAFAATTPDFMWVKKYLTAQRRGIELPNRNFLAKFHSWIQWRTGPTLWWVEAIWFVATGSILVVQL